MLFNNFCIRKCHEQSIALLHIGVSYCCRAKAPRRVINYSDVGGVRPGQLALSGSILGSDERSNDVLDYYNLAIVTLMIIQIIVAIIR